MNKLPTASRSSKNLISLPITSFSKSTRNLEMAPRVPHPAYDETPSNSFALYGDKELYAKIGAIAESESGKDLIEEFEIPIRSGKAWVVKKGE